jgi:hypothetical protein
MLLWRSQLNILEYEKENKIVVIGLTSQVLTPVVVEEKEKWGKGMVGENLYQVVGGSSDHILNLIQGWNKPNIISLAKVRMDNWDFTARLR